ncbi:MAG: hypothetical protein RLZZ301_1479 [Bacteroidota bacterium]|jgi:hypothetical protein
MKRFSLLIAFFLCLPLGFAQTCNAVVVFPKELNIPTNTLSLWYEAHREGNSSSLLEFQLSNLVAGKAAEDQLNGLLSPETNNSPKVQQEFLKRYLCFKLNTMFLTPSAEAQNQYIKCASVSPNLSDEEIAKAENVRFVIRIRSFSTYFSDYSAAIFSSIDCYDAKKKMRIISENNSNSESYIWDFDSRFLEATNSDLDNYLENYFEHEVFSKLSHFIELQDPRILSKQSAIEKLEAFCYTTIISTTDLSNFKSFFASLPLPYLPGDCLYFWHNATNDHCVLMLEVGNSVQLVSGALLNGIWYYHCGQQQLFTYDFYETPQIADIVYLFNGQQQAKDSAFERFFFGLDRQTLPDYFKTVSATSNSQIKQVVVSVCSNLQQLHPKRRYYQRADSYDEGTCDALHLAYPNADSTAYIIPLIEVIDGREFVRFYLYEKRNQQWQLDEWNYFKPFPYNYNHHLERCAEIHFRNIGIDADPAYAFAHSAEIWQNYVYSKSELGFQYLNPCLDSTKGISLTQQQYEARLDDCIYLMLDRDINSLYRNQAEQIWRCYTTIQKNSFRSAKETQFMEIIGAYNIINRLNKKFPDCSEMDAKFYQISN